MTKKKLGDVRSDFQSTPERHKLTTPYRPRDGFFDFLHDSMKRMAGFPTDTTQDFIHIAVVYRVEVDEGFLGLFGDELRVRARIMEPDLAHCTLVEPRGFDDNIRIDLLPEFSCDLALVGGNPPKVGDPIEVEFKNPDQKTKTFGNGMIRSILDKSKVQGVYDRSPFLNGKMNAMGTGAAMLAGVGSPLEECKSAKEKFDDLSPPGGNALRAPNKSLAVSSRNPRKLNSPTDDISVAQAEVLIAENPRVPRNRIRVKRGGPLDRNNDGFLDEDIGDEAQYNVNARTIKDHAGFLVRTAQRGAEIKKVMGGHPRRFIVDVKKAGAKKALKKVARDVGEDLLGSNIQDLIVGDGSDPRGPSGEAVLLGLATEGYAGVIPAVKKALDASGLDANLAANYYLNAKADPNTRIAEDVQRRKFKGGIDCNKIYSVKSFLAAKNQNLNPETILGDQSYNNKGPVPKTWDRHTNRRLKTLHPDCRHAAAEFINAAASIGMFLRITETYRTSKRQNELYAKGRTTAPLGKGNIVTYARGTPPSSIHQFGIAIDVVELSKGRNSITREKFEVPNATWANGYDKRYPKERWDFIGNLGKQFGFTWGGNFKKFADKPHFEILDFRASQLRAKVAAGDTTKDPKLPAPPYVYPRIGLSFSGQSRNEEDS